MPSCLEITKEIPTECLTQYLNSGWVLYPHTLDKSGCSYVTKALLTNLTNSAPEKIYPVHSLGLIQKGLIKRPLGKYIGGTLHEAVSFHYTGGMEYPIRKSLSLRRTQARHSLYKTYVVNDSELSAFNTMDHQFKLRIHACFDTKAELDTYVNLLLKMRRGELELKEPTYLERSNFTLENRPNHKYGFPLDYSGNPLADFWWDTDNDVFFGYDKPFMSRLPDHLKASFEMMDNIVAQNNLTINFLFGE